MIRMRSQYRFNSYSTFYDSIQIYHKKWKLSNRYRFFYSIDSSGCKRGRKSFYSARCYRCQCFHCHQRLHSFLNVAQNFIEPKTLKKWIMNTILRFSAEGRWMSGLWLHRLSPILQFLFFSTSVKNWIQYFYYSLLKPERPKPKMYSRFKRFCYLKNVHMTLTIYGCFCTTIA